MARLAFVAMAGMAALLPAVLGADASPQPLGPPFSREERVFTRYAYYDLQHVVPPGYSWNQFAQLAPTPAALQRALFLPTPNPDVLGDLVKVTRGPIPVHAIADSWQQLLAKAHPTFVWNDTDLLWIGADDRGRPLFVMDRAYLYQWRNERARWALFDVPGPNGTEAAYAAAGRRIQDQSESELRYVRAVAPWVKARPAPYCDAGLVHDYSRVVARHPRVGAVYEIGWQSEMSRGSCLCVELRLIYLLQEPTGRWQLLGEAMGNGRGKNGTTGNEYETTVARVDWPSDSTVEIRFLNTETQCMLGGENLAVDDRDFVTYEETILAGPFPSRPKCLTEHPYLLSVEGETFEGIVSHVARWCPGWSLEGEERAAAQEMWRRQLNRLNPALSRGAIAAGTRIMILRYSEFVDELEKVLLPLRNRERPR